MSTFQTVQHDTLSPSYWAKRWQTGDNIWQQSTPNPFLVKCLPALDAVKASVPSTRRPRIFLPLCGSTLDLLYLIQQGWHVIGLDAVEQPLREFTRDHLSELGPVHDVSHDGAATSIVHIAGEHIDLFCCDLFSSEVTPQLFGGKVDAVWDRGSFVAIGVQQRPSYVAKVVELLDHSKAVANWLLNAFDYNEDSDFKAPPHRLPKDAVQRLVDGHAVEIRAVDELQTMERWEDVKNLRFFNVTTYAITTQ